jgi:hypothetical protein
MENELQNDAEYLKTVLLITRDKLSNAIFSVTELEAMLLLEQQKSYKLQQLLDTPKKEG